MLPMQCLYWFFLFEVKCYYKNLFIYYFIVGIYQIINMTICYLFNIFHNLYNIFVQHHLLSVLLVSYHLVCICMMLYEYSLIGKNIHEYNHLLRWTLCSDEYRIFYHDIAMDGLSIIGLEMFLMSRLDELIFFLQ